MADHRKITIAIDGYSSCGKSTLAKALAKELNYTFIDTGAMYRAVAYHGWKKGWVSRDHLDQDAFIQGLDGVRISFVFNPDSGKREVELNGVNVEKEIRGMEVSSLVSKVAAIREVRVKLVDEQRRMGSEGGVVMDGRDIASVVFPNAELKLFITADPQIRAKRRLLELNDPNLKLEDVLKNLQERDHLDSTREEGPLIQTDDAIVIDNSELTQEGQLKVALGLVQDALSQLEK
ncbi:MAG: (d)CMP kinase [Bacteroidetes bacterium]|nr:MAG: (d)CMP kinase [Bacteroidota bacterium]